MTLDILTPEEAAAELGLAAYEVVDLCRSGRLRAVKIASHWRIPRAALSRIGTRGRVVVPAPRHAGCVYFAEACGMSMVKIGWSTSLDKRIRELSVSCPVPLRLIGVVRCVVEDERRFHARFAAHRRHGEWFALDAEILSFCEEHRP